MIEQAPTQRRVAAGGVLFDALLQARDRILLTDDQGRERTGAQLMDRIERLAGALAARGLAGRRIGLVYRNSIAAFEAFIAIERLGATRVPADPDLPPAEAQAIFSAAGVAAILADTEHGTQLSGALIHDDDHPMTGAPYPGAGMIPAETLLVLYPRQVAGGELFAVGTSYGNWNEVLRINCELYRTGVYGAGFGADEVGLTVQQLMHGTGMLMSFPFLAMGLPQFVLPRFHAETVLATIHAHRITALFGVPGMLTRLAARPDAAARAHSLRHCLYGGAPLTPAELRETRRILGSSLIQVYGRFEAGWPLAVLGQEEHQQILQGDEELSSSCGRLISQITYRLAPVTGRPRGHGELQTLSGMTAPAYADPEGWCSLGDVAYLDERGYLHLAGRLDGMINTGSYHVYPRQVEEAISADQGVAAVRVKGEPDPVWGQAVTAYIVPRDPHEWEHLLERLHRDLPSRLARYKMPKAYHQVAHLND